MKPKINQTVYCLITEGNEFISIELVVDKIDKGVFYTSDGSKFLTTMEPLFSPGWFNFKKCLCYVSEEELIKAKERIIKENRIKDKLIGINGLQLIKSLSDDKLNKLEELINGI
jgi:imidazoleglycerol phosphate synthase glutamine amidotransferase subunit HisH